MKQNVDLTEPGHFSDGWMTGGWTAKGVFRKRKPMKTSKLFKDILKMGNDKPSYDISSLAAKLFGLKQAAISLVGGGLTLGDNQIIIAGNWTTTTSTSVGTGDTTWYYTTNGQ